MAWETYTDHKNRAFSGILTTLFPEQTKTVPRIILWSIIFLADLIAGIVGAVHFGLLRFDAYRTSDQMMLAAGLAVIVIIGIFWLQGFVWYRIVNFFKKRNELG